MFLCVGLGNPGSKYATTRHNIGFMAVDHIADNLHFGPARNRFQGLVREGRIGSEKALILKPQTYMNLSGQSVAEAARFYKIPVGKITVFHDELDLAPGKIRIKTGGGHAGHNGLRSITQHIGADFQRIRIGIGHPGEKSQVHHYVLHPFAKADQDWITPLLEAISGAAEHLPHDGAQFQNQVAALLNKQQKKPSKADSHTPPSSNQNSTTSTKKTQEADFESDKLSPAARLAAFFNLKSD